MWKKQQVFLIILEKRESKFVPIKWKWALIESWDEDVAFDDVVMQ